MATTETDFPVPLDDEAAGIVRLAARIGVPLAKRIGGGRRDVTFTGLLVALLYRHTSQGRPLRRYVEDAGISVDAILQTVGVEPRDMRELADSERGAPDTGSESFSPTATVVLQYAADQARRVRGSDAAVSAGTIFSIYLFQTPDGHRKQMEAWGFTPAVSRQIADSIGESPPAEWVSTVQPQSGFDEDLPNVLGQGISNSYLLRLASVIARAPRRDRVVEVIDLLMAAIELPLIGIQFDSPELAVLRSFVRADDSRSAYANARTLLQLPDNLAMAVREVEGRQISLSRSARTIVEEAREFALTTGVTRPTVRHLVAALLTDRDGSDRVVVAESLALWSGSTEPLRAQLQRVIADRYPFERRDAWSNRLEGRQRHLIATVQADVIPADVRTNDQLGLRRYSDAIAALIAARAQTPPLSIAVFGPWGSGKSFFMRMIQEAARDFAAEGALALSRNEATPFHTRIVHIEFNAWHYAETNLWASLVHAILEALQSALSPMPSEQGAFDRLLSDLSLSRAAEGEARQSLLDAEARQAEALASLERASAEAAERRKVQQRLAAEDVLEGVRSMVLQELKPEGGSAQAWIQTIGDSVVKVASFMGRPDLAANVPDLERSARGIGDIEAALQTRVGAMEDLLNEARASANQGSALLTWLANADFAPAERRRLVVRAVSYGAAFLLMAIVLRRYGGEIAGWVGAVGVFVAPAIASVDLLLGWVRRNVAEASKAFAALATVRDRVDNARQERVSRHEVALQAAHRAAIEAEAEAAKRRADLEAAEAARRKAEENLRSATPAERMRRFVSGRLADGDYQRHLGLIHAIRSDLTQLERILNDVQRSFPAETAVQRVVLYIDDLDRCPPARVVEVLEAVHLLLAFPLFVVVVGVDIRWVSQALRQRYPQQLSGTAGIASPIDYLEKVFQIPFWLPPMDSAGGERLLAAAIGPPDAPAEESDSRPSRATAVEDDHEDRKETAPQQVHPTADDAGLVSIPAEAATTAAPVVRSQIPAEALGISDGERRRLIAFAASAGISPRRSKRFANLYRLLKASLSPAERRSFVVEHGHRGNFDTAMALLAATTGAPVAAAQLLDGLNDLPEPSVDRYDQLTRLLDGITPSHDERSAWASVCDALNAEPELAPDLMVRDLTELRCWAPRVQRFCFGGASGAGRREALSENPTTQLPI